MLLIVQFSTLSCYLAITFCFLSCSAYT